MGARRKARICALQMLFQYDVARPSVGELVRTYWGELASEVPEDARGFSTDLALGAIGHVDEIDALIASRAENWRISRMAVVDRNILRLAIYEFIYEAGTPNTVAINEALEIARRFSTFEATQFINGILDAIKRDLETNQNASTAAGRS
jgi:transcription antitermination protein NusB